MNRTLIFGTSYVSGRASQFLFGLWRELVTQLNPEADVLVVDSASPDLPSDLGRATVLQLGDNIGHLSRTGRDGWGRAFTEGLRFAIGYGYDRVVHVETDLLFARPVAETLAKMQSYRIPVAAPMAAPFSFIETALMFMDVGYIKNIGLIERYDWQRPEEKPLPEYRIAQIVEPDLFALTLRGLRNDLHGINAGNLRVAFPDGLDWITHCQDLAVYRAFLRMNGLDGAESAAREEMAA